MRKIIYGLLLLPVFAFAQTVQFKSSNVKITGGTIAGVAVTNAGANINPVGDKGTPRGVRYMQMTAVLVKAIQDQQAEINKLKKSIHRNNSR